MNYKGHLFLGVSLSILFIIIMFLWKGWYSNFNFNLNLQILLLIFVSPLMADLDHRHGKLREWVTVLGLLFAIFGMIISRSNITNFGVIIACIAYLLYYTTNHRGFTHTLWFSCVYGCIIYYMTKEIHIGILGVFSYYTHLLGDKLWCKLY